MNKRSSMRMLGAALGGLATVIATPGCTMIELALASNRDAARTNREIPAQFFGLYKGNEDDTIQREIYRAAEHNQPIKDSTIKKATKFFSRQSEASVSEEDIARWAESQRDYYKEVLNFRRENKGLIGISPLSLLDKNFFTAQFNLYGDTKREIENLRQAHLKIDPNYKGNLSEKYDEINSEVNSKAKSR